jgi:hypothetical protein
MVVTWAWATVWTRIFTTVLSAGRLRTAWAWQISEDLLAVGVLVGRGEGSAVAELALVDPVPFVVAVMMMTSKAKIAIRVDQMGCRRSQPRRLGVVRRDGGVEGLRGWPGGIDTDVPPYVLPVSKQDRLGQPCS